MDAQPPNIPLDRPLTDDEWAAAVVWTLLYPRFNPRQDWLSLGEFLPKLLGMDSAPQTAFNAANGGEDAVRTRVNEQCWRWAILGLLVPVGEQRFALTSAGRQVLGEQWDESAIVLSPGGLAARLGALRPPPDESVLFYADQAQQCFVAGLYHPAAVLIGIASEAALIPLFDALAALALPLTLNKAKSRTARERVEWLRESFRDRASAITNHLVAQSQSGRWVDDLDGLLLGEADAVRLIRNDAGHPTPARLDRATVMTLLAVFPVLVEAVTVTASGLKSTFPAP
ncbi:MAG: hypothetical protein HY875_10530 [Chloroflexi bacterium]|nr:hypothetical protein [Chloroflexota bacterium]